MYNLMSTTGVVTPSFEIQSYKVAQNKRCHEDCGLLHQNEAKAEICILTSRSHVDLKCEIVGFHCNESWFVGFTE